MSAHRLVLQATRTASMSGQIFCIYGDRYRRRKWKRGVKKGLIKARRRTASQAIRDSLDLTR